MNTSEQYRRLFGVEPSPASARALDEIARLAGPDDPMMLIAMFLQHQNELFDVRGAMFVRHAGELERGADYVRGCGQDLAAAGTSMKEAAGFVATHVGDVTAVVDALDTQVARLIDVVDGGAGRLQRATSALRDEQLWYRLDLKLAAVAAILLALAALVVMTTVMWRTPPMSVETAAAVLVGRDAAPGLIELQQRGDLKALLDCSGDGWRKSIGYCQPVIGGTKARGWNTAPSAPPLERAAPFGNK